MPFNIGNLAQAGIAAASNAIGGGGFGSAATAAADALRQPSDAQPAASAPRPVAPAPPVTSTAQQGSGAQSRPWYQDTRILVAGGAVAAVLVLIVALRR